MRTKRQAALIALINNGAVRSQGDARKLLGKAGFATTQATVSRDLEEIGAVRVRDSKGIKYSLHRSASEYGVSVETVIKSYVISAHSAGTIVVIKTPPGHAGMVAAAFDRAELEGVLGTVAGDDTLFLCVSTEEKGVELIESMKR